MALQRHDCHLYNGGCRRNPAGLAGRIARVLRGGAYNNEDRNLRCARRNRNNPNNRNNNVGFRVVVCALSHASLEDTQVLRLYVQVGNAFHLRMTAETANGEIAQSRPG